jgi:uncharacterized protein (TIGR02466 family)
MNYNIFPLFSTPLYTCDTGRLLSIEEEKFISSLPEKELEMGNYGSVNTYLLDLPELAAFKKFCEFHLNLYVKDVLRIKQEIHITHSWTTRNPKGTHHHAHDHPNSIISGVYYAKAPSGNITLVHKRQFSKSMDFQYDFYDRNIFNCDTWEVTVGDGLLVLFPSWLKHDIAPNTSSQDRRIIGFNTFTSGDFGNIDYVNHVSIK